MAMHSVTAVQTTFLSMRTRLCLRSTSLDETVPDSEPAAKAAELFAVPFDGPSCGIDFVSCAMCADRLRTWKPVATIMTWWSTAMRQYMTRKP